MVYTNNCNHIISRADRSASPMIQFAIKSIVLQYPGIQSFVTSHFQLYSGLNLSFGGGGGGGGGGRRVAMLERPVSSCLQYTSFVCISYVSLLIKINKNNIFPIRKFVIFVP